MAILVAFISLNFETFAQVGVGIASPNANAMLDLTTTTKGFLPPRLSTVQKSALGAQLLLSPLPEDNGMLVFDNDLNEFYFWNGLIWVRLASGNYVDLTSNQMMIGGMKTFTNGVTVNGMLMPQGRLMLPMGEISYFNYTGFNVPITSTMTSPGALGTDNMVKINPTVTSFVNDGFGTGTNSRLTYTGATTRYFHIALSFSYQSVSGNDTFVFGVAKNGVVQNSSKMFITTGLQGNDQSTALHVLLSLALNDYIEFYVGNTEDADDVLMTSFNFVAIGM